jgi:hypothetical protein
LFFSDYIYNIDPKFKKFNTTIGEMCNEARRAIWKIEPSAEFDFDGEVHRKPVKTESTASSETSSTDSNSLQAFNTSDDNNEQLTESQLNSFLDSTLIAENTYSFITKTTNILNNDQELQIATSASPYDVINLTH